MFLTPFDIFFIGCQRLPEAMPKRLAKDAYAPHFYGRSYQKGWLFLAEKSA